jgi:hypothetical protein
MHCCLWILDHPLSRMMTAELMAAIAHDITIREISIGVFRNIGMHHLPLRYSRFEHSFDRTEDRACTE